MTPIIVEGPRGAGKTMILKYISYFCQKELISTTVSTDFATSIQNMIKKRSLGVYFRYKDDFCSAFQFLNCSMHIKEQLFLYYFEMNVLDELFNIIIDLFENGVLQSPYTQRFLNDVNRILSVSSDNFYAVRNCIKDRIRSVDQWIRKSRYIGKAAEEHLLSILSEGDYIHRVCNSFISGFPALRSIRFLIIIDEYENAGEYQRVLNTLLKQVDHTSNITYRIGVRPKGIQTFDTNIAGEELQINRDYLLYVLQSQRMVSYKSFLRQVAQRRLENECFFKENGLTDIQTILGSKENLDVEAQAIVKGSKKHFELLRKKYSSDEEYTKAVQLISYPSSPLMEMLNIVWVMRGIPCERVKKAMEGYLSGSYKFSNNDPAVGDAKKYKLDYTDKYRFQLLSILIGIYRARKKYYSFNTFAYLSSGSVNDFISLCRNVFYHLDDSNYYHHVSFNKCINMDLQAIGAEETSIEQLDKIRLCKENGLNMYTFAMNMGELFRMFHRDIYAKYPETNQFAFQSEKDIEDRPLLNDVYNSLIKWGVIIKKPRIQSISIGLRKGKLYYLNRMFSPIFGISYRTRGGFNFILSTSLFEQLVNAQMEGEKILSWKAESQSDVSTSNNDSQKAPVEQLTLF